MRRYFLDSEFLHFFIIEKLHITLYSVYSYVLIRMQWIVYENRFR